MMQIQTFAGGVGGDEHFDTAAIERVYNATACIDWRGEGVPEARPGPLQGCRDIR